jgi:hypothetical protein
MEKTIPQDRASGVVERKTVKRSLLKRSALKIFPDNRIW